MLFDNHSTGVQAVQLTAAAWHSRRVYDSVYDPTQCRLLIHPGGSPIMTAASARAFCISAHAAILTSILY